ncbi:B-cell receptor CD22-like [Cololabis saira]|uniref:B-cell receptor CD22-like n=1 Tax=Cololabis saira TaxID=129043 RepID=UPI002AD59694|nr:B-cell receptor CD22-like [Cololabis saira]
MKKMGHTLFSELFLLCSLLYTGRAQDAVLTIEPSWSTYFVGETFTFICDMKEGRNDDWEYTFIRDGRDFVPYDTHQSYTLYPLHTSDTVTNKVVVMQQPNWPQIFRGETITLTCEVQGGETTEWRYEWRRSGSDTPWKYEKTWTFTASESSSGDYTCKTRRRDDLYSSTETGEAFRLLLSDKPKARLVQISKTTPVGGSVSLSCSVENSAGWKYDWFRRTSKTNEVQVRTNDVNGVIRVSQGGIYRCRGSSGEQNFYTETSDEVTCEITFTNKVVVMQQPNWPQIFRGETITLTCEVQGGETTEWEYKWRRSGSHTQWKYEKTWSFTASESSSGDYTCKTRRKDDPYSSTETSEAFRLSLSDEPKTQLRADVRLIPVGGRVTLSCSVNPSSSGWRYYWYRDEESSEPLTSPDAVSQSDGQISVSQGGIYWCRGGRGEPVYYTNFSDPVNIDTGVEFKEVYLK